MAGVYSYRLKLSGINIPFDFATGAKSIKMESSDIGELASIYFS